MQKTPNFQIKNTAFSTITINYNYRTGTHKDRGDLEEGFGNLIVCEDDQNPNKFGGSYLGFPQFGVAVDVRQGDFLAMDVHQWHANLPMHPANKTVRRLSVVCYLRINIWKRTRGLSQRRMRLHDAKVRKLGKHPKRPKTIRSKHKAKGTRKARGKEQTYNTEDNFQYSPINFL